MIKDIIWPNVPRSFDAEKNKWLNMARALHAKINNMA